MTLPKLSEREELKAAMRAARASALTVAARRAFAPGLVLVVVLILWEVVVRSFDIPTYLVPAPSVVLRTMSGNSDSLASDALVTLVEAALGFTLGAGFAFVLGAAFVRWQAIERGMGPLIIALQAVPIVASAPLLIIWFGNGLLSKVIMAALICFFPMVVNTTVGLRSVEREALDLMKLLKATQLQVFWKLRVPAALPFLFSGLRISATLSVIGAVVAELAGATKGIGFQIMVSSYRTDTPLLFSAVIFSALTGLFFFGLIVLLERLVVGRRGADREI